MRVQDVREYFKTALANEDFVTDKTGVKTVEMVGASFLADEESIFGKVNYDYVRREIDWYLSQSLNVNDLENCPEIWKQVADADGFVNSNYGRLVYSSHNYHQYFHVKTELEKNPNSRRAVMIYQRPSMWLEYNYNGRSDFCCTNAHQYFIRNGQLDVVVQMRSNDLVFGFKNDRAWADYVLSQLAADLKVPKGQIHWQVGSLHAYERHFHLIK